MTTMLALRPGDVAAYKAALLRDPCSYCDADVDVLDHIEPKVHGGSGRWENLTPSCSFCNTSKSARSLLGFPGARASGIYERVAALEAERSAWQRLGLR